MLLLMEILYTMRPELGFRMAANLPLIQKKTMTLTFADMKSSSNDVAVFFLSGLVTGPGFMSIS